MTHRSEDDRVSVVVPTVRLPYLAELLGRLGRSARMGPAPAELILVDDRPEAGGEAEGGAGGELPVPPELAARTRVLASGGRGPAAARNQGWREAQYPWVVFLDDDVLPDLDWAARLAGDLRGAAADVGGIQGRVRVPRPAYRRPTDAERNVVALADADWITADMAYRRDALDEVGGFDERFLRAYREDVELAYRVHAAGWRLVRGARTVSHPAGPADWATSLRAQRGNADDALLRRMYGPDWRRRLAVPAGRRRWHAGTTAAGLLAVAAGLGGRTAAAAGAHRAAGLAGAAAAAAGVLWAAATAEFAVRRIRPGPRHPREVATMLVTSVAIPPLACGHWLRGWVRARGAAGSNRRTHPDS